MLVVACAGCVGPTLKDHSESQAGAVHVVPWKYAAGFWPLSLDLSLSPTDRGELFRAEDTIAVVSLFGSRVAVYDVRGKQVYAGKAGRLPTLKPGHYFVESASDRVQFCILPRGYTNAPLWGADDDLWPDHFVHLQSAGVGYVRTMSYWWNLTTPQMTWGQYDWRMVDDCLACAKALNARAIFQMGFWPKYATDPSTCTIDRYQQYAVDLCKHIKNSPNAQYAYAFTLWNEPWYQNRDFRFAVPDAGSVGSPHHPFGWSGTWIDWVAAMYRQVIPAMKSVLPASKVYGGCCQDWEVELKLLQGLQSRKATTGVLDGVSMHVGTLWGNVDSTSTDHDTGNPGGYGHTMDEWLDTIKATAPGCPLFCVDEFYPWRSSVTAPASISVLGMPQSQSEGVAHSNQDWWDSYITLTKAAVIMRSRDVTPVLHMGMRGSHVVTAPELPYIGWAATPSAKRGRGPYPQVSAWIAAWHQLKNLRFVSQTEELGVLSYVFTDGSATRVFRWCRRGLKAKLASRYPCTDVFGNPLSVDVVTDEPLIFGDTDFKVVSAAS